MKVKNIKTWTAIFLLIALEQGIKLVINNNFLNKTAPIVPPFLYFEPMFNRHYSWFNSMLQLGVGKWVHIVFTGAMLIFIYLFYSYLNSRYGNVRLINVMFAFLFSGALCSLIDKILWDGSLDYIYVNGFFTFDLKDVYLNVFNGLMILSLFLKKEVLNKVDEKELLKGFGKFLMETFSSTNS